ncbi:hypothetical protein EZS27_011672 [termite gut metagenome]|jgi:hypothetical protein|uniref:Uncharacterized protein n=1 Tax=termite gut metagenome TaxID=433724 RepID=A0A5J4S3X4_9ZZZZ
MKNQCNYQRFKRMERNIPEIISVAYGSIPNIFSFYKFYTVSYNNISWLA